MNMHVFLLEFHFGFDMLGNAVNHLAQDEALAISRMKKDQFAMQLVNETDGNCEFNT